MYQFLPAVGKARALASCEWPHPLTQVYHQMLSFCMHHDLKRLGSTELRKDCSSINYQATLLHTDEVFQFDAQKCQINPALNSEVNGLNYSHTC